MARKKHENFKLKKTITRSPESRDGLKIYLIACEGECTEPNYLQGLVKHQKKNKKIAAGTEIRISKHSHSDPRGVLQDLLDTPNREQFDESWIVIDRDPVEYKGKGIGGHSKENFEIAIKDSKENNVKVACSNPCFELWLVLHFEYRDTSCTRDDIQKKALEKINTLLEPKAKIKNVDDMKSLTNIYDLVKDKVFTAKKYAEKLKQNDLDNVNPSTGMYKLLESLMSKEEKNDSQNIMQEYFG